MDFYDGPFYDRINFRNFEFWMGLGGVIFLCWPYFFQFKHVLFQNKNSYTMNTFLAAQHRGLTDDICPSPQIPVNLVAK